MEALSTAMNAKTFDKMTTAGSLLDKQGIACINTALRYVPLSNLIVNLATNVRSEFEVLLRAESSEYQNSLLEDGILTPLPVMPEMEGDTGVYYSLAHTRPTALTRVRSVLRANPDHDFGTRCIAGWDDEKKDFWVPVLRLPFGREDVAQNIRYQLSSNTGQELSRVSLILTACKMRGTINPATEKTFTSEDIAEMFTGKGSEFSNTRIRQFWVLGQIPELEKHLISGELPETESILKEIGIQVPNIESCVDNLDPDVDLVKQFVSDMIATISALDGKLTAATMKDIVLTWISQNTSLEVKVEKKEKTGKVVTPKNEEEPSEEEPKEQGAVGKTKPEVVHKELLQAIRGKYQDSNKEMNVGQFVTFLLERYGTGQSVLESLEDFDLQF